MPPPHPLSSLAAGGPAGRALAVEQLRDLLTTHGGDVRATANALVPKVHETTLHDWIVKWGLGEARRGRARKKPGGEPPASS